MNSRNAPVAAFAALFLLFLNSVTRAEPIITEFLAANQNGLVDSDGDRPDWIEIHNPDGVAVDLGGYHLTDDAGEPTRWTFPAGAIIQPGGYLIVFASGKDRAVAGSPLHTNFSLDAAGEYLSLRAPGGTPVLTEFPSPFAVQSDNISYGSISTTPGAPLAYFNTPSPGAANNPGTAPAESVQFSLSSRTFVQPATLSVALTVNSPTATIRYTTNRSVPTAASTLYTGTPITVSTNTRIRARAFEPGRPDGPVRSETYFRLDSAAQTFTSNLPIVVTTSWNTVVNNDAVVPAHIMIFEPKSGLARLTNLPDVSTPCSIERRGSSTAGDPKYSLTVEMWDESNNDREFEVLGMPEESDWVMHAPYNFDRSFMHNDLIYRLSNEAGRYAVRTKYVEHFHNTTVTPDGIEGALTGSVDYFGVYSFMEKIKRGGDRVDVENLSTADNTAPAVQGGYIFKVDRLDPGDSGITPLPGQSFGNVGTMGPGNNVMAWVEPKQSSPDPTLVVTTAQSNYLRQYIGDAWAVLSGPNFMDPVNGYAKWWDVGSVIDHNILNTATKNADAMRLSAFWHKPRFGKLTAGPVWDFDRAEGSTDGRDLNPISWRGEGGDLGTDFFHYPWYNEMFRDPNFWQAWIDRYHELRLGVLSTANVHAVIDEFAAQLNPGDAASTPAKRSGTRWLGPRGAAGNTPGTNGQYTGEVAWLKNWWSSRLNFMDGQFTRPAVASIPDGPITAGTTVTLTSPSTSTPGVKIYYTTDGTDPRPRATVPDTIAPVATVAATLIADNNPVRAIVPSAALDTTYGTTWRGADLNANGNNADDFNDSTWFTAPVGAINGVGYDDDLATSYLPYIGLRWNSPNTANPTNPPAVSPNNATSTMRNNNASCYIRLPFTVTPGQAPLITAPYRLRLLARYDDAFVVYLNGELVTQSALVPNGVVPGWNYNVTTNREYTPGVAPDEIDLTAHIGKLHVGENILAIQAINGSSSTSSDLLFQCKLEIVDPLPPYNPAVSASAIEYTGPITINANTQLFVRTLNPIRPSDPPTLSGGGTGTVPNGSSWSAPTHLFFYPGAVAASFTNLQVSEFHYHPSTPTAAELAAGFDNSNDFEFIRLTNIGTSTVDLTGIFFSDGVEFEALPGYQNLLAPGASVVLVENTAGYQSRYGNAYTILGQYNGDLNDGGERVILNAKNGDTIANITYDDDGNWPKLADGERSLLYNGGNLSAPGSWRVSLDPGGSGVGTYDTFKKRYFDGGTIPVLDQNPLADPDRDGLVNLLEFALALDPKKPDAPTFTSPILSVRRRPATTCNLTYSVVTSPNLTTWSDGPAPTSVTQNPDGTETAIYAPTAGETIEFLRFKVVSP
jgi:hypothetical protein